MSAEDRDPTARFTERAQAYAQARPGYPRAIPSMLAREFGLGAETVVADLGSGTGLSSEPFLIGGWHVVGVEPNASMRAQGDRRLAAYPRFRSVDGRAEATGLADAGVDLVIAAQAFHWFDIPAARTEALRVLRRPALAALIWNDRRGSGSAFAEGYERLLLAHGVDYAEVRHRHAHADSVSGFFGGRHWREVSLPYADTLDFDTLAARLTSASYVPAPGSPGFEPMLASLRMLFDATQRGGRVEMAYDTRVFFGALDAAGESVR